MIHTGASCTHITWRGAIDCANRKAHIIGIRHRVKRVRHTGLDATFHQRWRVERW